MLRVPFTRLSLLFDIIHPELCFLPVPWLCCIVYVSPLHSQEPQLKISIFTACSSWWHYKCLSKPTRTYQGLPGPTTATRAVLIKSVAFVPGALYVWGSKASAGTSGPIDPWRLEQHVEENHGESWESLFMSCENLRKSSCHHFFRTFIAASCRTGTCTSCSTCLLFVGLGCGIPKMKSWNSKYPVTSTCQKNTGFFKRNSHPTWTLARTARHPWSPNF